MKITKYDAGVPCWADLMVSDIEKAKTFYSRVFGWEMNTDPNPDFGGYTTAEYNGGTVCGLMGTQSPDQPNAWSVHLATDNIDETINTLKENGGQVVVDKMVVADHGTLAGALDPQGAYISFWQANKMIGSTIANEYNTICWDELATTDLQAAKKFYTQLFNYETGEGSTDDYFYFAVGGQERGGMRPVSEYEPTSYWSIYIRVENLEDAAKVIEENGGKILMPKMEAGPIEFQACTDDQGAIFSICQFQD